MRRMPLTTTPETDFQNSFTGRFQENSSCAWDRNFHLTFTKLLLHLVKFEADISSSSFYSWMGLRHVVDLLKQMTPGFILCGHPTVRIQTPSTTQCARSRLQDTGSTTRKNCSSTSTRGTVLITEWLALIASWYQFQLGSRLLTFHSQSWLYYISKGWFRVVLSSLCFE